MLGHQGGDGSTWDRKLLCCWFHFVSTGGSFSLRMACSVFRCDLVLIFLFLSKKIKLMGEQSSGSLTSCCGGRRCLRSILRSSAVEAVLSVPWSRRVRTGGVALQDSYSCFPFPTLSKWYPGGPESSGERQLAW